MLHDTATLAPISVVNEKTGEAENHLAQKFRRKFPIVVRRVSPATPQRVTFAGTPYRIECAA